jgi:hypothetical protein
MPCFLLESELDSGHARARSLREKYAVELERLRMQRTEAAASTLPGQTDAPPPYRSPLRVKASNRKRKNVSFYMI